MTKTTMMTALAMLTTALLGGVSALPSRIHVERSRAVDASPEEIRPLLANYRQRHTWIPWTVTDPDARYSYSGTPGTVGSTMSWVGDEVGEATITLRRVTSREVVSDMHYDAPLEMDTRDRFVLEPLADGRTRVTWINEGPATGLVRVFAVFADGVIGPDYEAGLARLGRTLAERDE
ncbi:MAG: SRPBCC family protein [Sandaracinaceae bacterium]